MTRSSRPSPSADPQAGGVRDDDLRSRAPRDLHAGGRVHRRPSGVVLGVKANVGGVGLAMMMLMAARVWLVRRDGLSHGVKLGVEFWATMYIPIVVAMAAQQNVVAAARGGPIVLIAGLGTVSVCFACVALISRLGRRRELPAEEVAEIERGGYVIGGDTPPDFAGPVPRQRAGRGQPIPLICSRGLIPCCT